MLWIGQYLWTDLLTTIFTIEAEDGTLRHQCKIIEALGNEVVVLFLGDVKSNPCSRRTRQARRIFSDFETKNLGQRKPTTEDRVNRTRRIDVTVFVANLDGHGLN